MAEISAFAYLHKLPIHTSSNWLIAYNQRLQGHQSLSLPQSYVCFRLSYLFMQLSSLLHSQVSKREYSENAWNNHLWTISF